MITYDSPDDQIISEANALATKLRSRNKFTLQQLIDDTKEYTTFQSTCDLIRMRRGPNAACNAAETLLTNENNLILSSPQFYNIVSELYDNNTNKFLEQVILACVNAGALLENRTMLQRIDQEIAKIKTLITSHCTKPRHIKLTESQIAGVQHMNLTLVNNSPITYALPLDAISYNECMRYVVDPDVRKLVETAYVSVYDEISDDIARMVVLRHKRAQLLGFASHSNKSDADDELLMEFLKKLASRYNKELTMLKKLTPELNSWDINYGVTRWKKSYGVVDNDIRNYFVITPTINKMIDLLGRIFDWQITIDNNTYTVHSTSCKIIVDLFARAGKHPQIKCITVGDQVYLLASFRGKTMTHADLINCWHELVLAFQYILRGGTVDTKYAKLPAMVLEYLCWDSTVLMQLSAHIKTGATIPEELVRKITRIRDVNVGGYYRKHLLTAMYDQIIYSDDEVISGLETAYKQKQSAKMFKAIYSQLHVNLKQKTSLNPAAIMPLTWNDLVQYDAVYYTHIQNKIYAADIFLTKFKKLDRQVCNEFKQFILNLDKDTITTYLGRKPTVDSFIELHGVDDQEQSYFIPTDIAETPYDIVEYHVASDVNRFTEAGSEVIKLNGNYDYASETTETLERYKSVFMKPVKSG